MHLLRQNGYSSSNPPHRKSGSHRFHSETLRWLLDHAETQLWIEPPEPVLQAVSSFVTAEHPSWTGSPTELLEALQLDMKANQLSTKLNVNARRLLSEHGIRYTRSRNHAGRQISLELVGRDDA